MSRFNGLLCKVHRQAHAKLPAVVVVRSLLITAAK